MNWLINKIKPFSAKLVKNKQDLLNLLHRLAQDELIESNSVDIIENILQLSSIQARQIMTTKPHIVSINSDVQPTAALDIIITELLRKKDW